MNQNKNRGGPECGPPLSKRTQIPPISLGVQTPSILGVPKRRAGSTRSLPGVILLFFLLFFLPRFFYRVYHTLYVPCLSLLTLEGYHNLGLLPLVNLHVGDASPWNWTGLYA
jgi:hypothetical protein